MTKGERFTGLVTQVAREVVRRRSSDVCCGDLTLEQFETLSVVQRAGDSTIGTLSGALGVELSTMSRNVSVLERNGYLQRQRSETDGRVVLVRLTAKGRKAVSTLRCGERDVLAEIYDRIPVAERDAVVKALELLSCCFSDSGADASASSCCAPTPLRRPA